MADKINKTQGLICYIVVWPIYKPILTSLGYLFQLIISIAEIYQHRTYFMYLFPALDLIDITVEDYKDYAIMGRLMRIFCTVRGSRSIHVSWYKDGYPIDTSLTKRNPWLWQIEHTFDKTYLFYLNIDSVSMLDAGRSRDIFTAYNKSQIAHSFHDEIIVLVILLMRCFSQHHITWTNHVHCVGDVFPCKMYHVIWFLFHYEICNLNIFMIIKQAKWVFDISTNYLNADISKLNWHKLSLNRGIQMCCDRLRWITKQISSSQRTASSSGRNTTNDSNSRVQPVYQCEMHVSWWRKPEVWIQMVYRWPPGIWSALEH